MLIINIFGTLCGDDKKKSGHSALLKALFEHGHSTGEVVDEILTLMIGATVELSIGSLVIIFLSTSSVLIHSFFLALTNVVNLLLVSEENASFVTGQKY